MVNISTNLKELAKEIGWSLVNEDKGFSTYEYEIAENKYEHISHIVRILDQPNELEIFEIFLSLIKVLPCKLRIKVNKLISKVKENELSNVLEIVSFTVSEFKKKTEYAKLEEYAKMLGVNLLELGFNYEYKLKKERRQEILSQIEVNLPMELAPILGKIKKTEYKIAYIKNKHLMVKEAE